MVDGGRVGHGCSYGNAGWITPCFALPLPMPGMMRKVVPWLLNGDSPLHIQPRPSRTLAWWLARFMLAMTEQSLRNGVAALTALSKYSLQEYERLNEETRGTLSFDRRGLLLVAGTADGLRYAKREMQLVAAHGIAGVATGHQMLGLQTAPATGRLVADLVLRRTPAFDPAPFRPDRF